MSEQEEIRKPFQDISNKQKKGKHQSRESSTGTLTLIVDASIKMLTMARVKLKTHVAKRIECDSDTP
jgi:hypothetical protein